MKPLTIEELKALKQGDWVYLFYLPQNDAEYGRIEDDFNFSTCKQDRFIRTEHYRIAISDSDFCTRWRVYKNKEQAEAKGEIIELFSDVSKSIYCKQHSRKYLKSWTKERLVEQVECLQHNVAVLGESIYNQVQYFEKCVQDEVQKRLTDIQERLQKAIPPIGCTVGGGRYGWDRAIDRCLEIFSESDKSE